MCCGRSIADPPDGPVVVEASREVSERLTEFGDGPESLQPEALSLQRADESLDAPVALGCRTKDGLDSMPRVLSSSWKVCEMNWLP